MQEPCLIGILAWLVGLVRFYCYRVLIPGKIRVDNKLNISECLVQTETDAKWLDSLDSEVTLLGSIRMGESCNLVWPVGECMFR